MKHYDSIDNIKYNTELHKRYTEEECKILE